MERWVDKVAVVTGASSGIGAACCKHLVRAGMIVVGLARRKGLVEELRKDLKDQANKLHAIKCDLRSEADIITTFENIERSIGPIAVLINNAGVATNNKLTRENNGDELRAIIETNVLGVAYCTREAFCAMKRRGIDGHVILINSIVGLRVPNLYDFSIYTPSKHAITAMTEIYRNEFAAENTKVKLTSISPGLVDTEILPDREIFSTNPNLKSSDIADSVVYVLQTPPHVQIHELIIKPIGERI